MQNRNKLPIPLAGDSFSLVSVQRTHVREAPPKQEDSRRGKLNYLGGPDKKKDVKPARPVTRIEERKSLSVGRFFGDGEKLTAFVMIDPEDLSTP